MAYSSCFFKIFFASLVLFSVVSNDAYAATYYVSTTGSDSNSGTLAMPWKNIQKAANTAVAGDTIYIRSGTYNAQVIVSKSGSSSAYITYSAYPGETVTLDGASVSIPVGPGNAMFQINANYITVNGLRIINSKADGIFTDGDHVTISNNYIRDTTYCTYPVADACSPIKIIGASNIVIEGNEVTRPSTYVAGAQVAETWQEAISVALSSNGIIRNNYVHHNSGECYNVKNGASNWAVYNNKASHCTSNAFYVDSWDKYTHDIEYYNNTVVDTDNNAFVIGSEHGGLLENVYYHNNIAYNNPDTTGFIILDNSWNEFSPNFKNIYIYNNIAYNNTFGFYIARGKGTATNVIFKDNIAAFNTDAQIIWTNSGAGGVTLKYNLVYPFKNYANEVKGSSPLESDPLFANPATLDFHLKSKGGRWAQNGWVTDAVSSPAIDAGDPSSAYRLEPAPNGGRINMGMHGNTAEASKSGSIPDYSATFSQSGVPSGTIWGLNVNGVHYTATTSSISVSGLSGSVSYSYDTSVAGSTGTRYVCDTGCSGSVSSATTVSGSYKTQYSLTISASPQGAGTTTPSAGTYWYGSGATVSISASPNSGYGFVSWAGAGLGSYSGNINAVSITLNSQITETSNFISIADTVAPSQDPIAYWKFDEGTGTITSDSSGNGNTASVNGAAWVSSGKFGSALQFDGVNDYVDAGAAASLNITGDITIETWINPLSINTVNSIVTKGTAGANYGYFFAIGSAYGNSINFQLANETTGTTHNLNGNVTLSTNTWHHVVGLRNGNVMQVYVNGALSGQITNFSGAIRKSGVNLNVGKYGSGSYFNGVIDEVRIYNRALSAAEIKAEYDAANTRQPTCSDGIQNQGEQGIDCGWPCQACPDKTAPLAITDLAASSQTSNSITLTWTAPGDDENIGTASQYDIRYSLSAITDATWASATHATGAPIPSAAGTAQSFTITGLSAATKYYFAIKAIDDSGNAAGLSNQVSHTTLSLFAPTVSLNVPQDAAILSSADVSFLCSATGENALKSIYLYGTWNGWAVKDTKTVSLQRASSNFIQKVPDGTYEWNCYAVDIASNSGYSVNNYTFTVDTMPPEIYFPDQAQMNQIVNVPYAEISVLSNEPLSYAILEWNGVNESMFGFAKSWSKSKSALPNGNYTFRVWGNDTAGNWNNTAMKWLYINHKSRKYHLKVALSDGFGKIYSGATVSIYNDTRRLLSEYTYGIAAPLAEMDVESTMNYQIVYTAPYGTILNIMNISIKDNITLAPQFIESYNGSIPARIESVSGVVALNATGIAFESAEITLPITRAPNRILHCTDWSASQTSCLNWELKDISEYNAIVNKTHVVFRAASFDAYMAGYYDAPETCFDGIKNGNEEGIDCGGYCNACYTAPQSSSGGNSGGVKTANKSGRVASGGVYLDHRSDAKITSYPKEINIPKGVSNTFSIAVKNTGNVDLHDLAIEISSAWFDFENTTFSLAANETKKIPVKVSVPVTASNGSYMIKITLKGIDTVSFVLTIIDTPGSASIAMIDTEIVKTMLEDLKRRINRFSENGQNVIVSQDFSAKAELLFKNGNILESMEYIALANDALDKSLNSGSEAAINGKKRQAALFIYMSVGLIVLLIAFIIHIRGKYAREKAAKSLSAEHTTEEAKADEYFGKFYKECPGEQEDYQAQTDTPIVGKEAIATDNFAQESVDAPAKALVKNKKLRSRKRSKEIIAQEHLEEIRAKVNT